MGILFVPASFASCIYIIPAALYSVQKQKQMLHVFDPKPNSVWSKGTKLESMSPSFREKDIGSLWGMITDQFPG